MNIYDESEIRRTVVCNQRAYLVAADVADTIAALTKERDAAIQAADDASRDYHAAVKTLEGTWRSLVEKAESERDALRARLDTFVRDSGASLYPCEKCGHGRTVEECLWCERDAAARLNGLLAMRNHSLLARLS